MTGIPLLTLRDEFIGFADASFRTDIVAKPALHRVVGETELPLRWSIRRAPRSPESWHTIRWRNGRRSTSRPSCVIIRVRSYLSPSAYRSLGNIGVEVRLAKFFFPPSRSN